MNQAATTATDNSVKHTEIERVTEEFIATIRDRGIVHTFEWMSAWFDRVAKAETQDDLINYLAPHSKDKAAINLHLMDRMMQMASQITNKSSSASSNMMREARVSVMAQMVEKNHYGYGSGKSRREEWDRWEQTPEVKTRLEALQASQNPEPSAVRKPEPK
jgi:hypothetical protein